LYPSLEDKTMNRTIAALTFASLLMPCSLVALAAEKTAAESATPATAESNDEKANKKGEEASGSSSGADSQSMEKEADSSTETTDKAQPPKQ
jgi:hypothetical protein